ncbi:IS630 family transposase [Micromonospora sp. 4G55]|uniref:IS630 family transposase n=1 Tax=Micromonospora sp. 4G55 TaxID=2806102 RepID=UPI001A56351C|nr:IS630 family transposase [Micromonospora sp. 4G55]MBM0255705.1 IS630 family transposase [Micromonospora sp. 4G55]
MGDGRGPKLGPLELTAEEREALRGLARRPKTAQGLAVRARIVLACAEGLSNSEVSRRLGVSLPTVGKWRKRFVADRVDGLRDEPRPGAPRKIGDAQVEAVITKTLEELPSNQDSHWSTRSMAKAVGLNQTAVSRIWRAFGLKPHQVDSWKLSTDPLFVDKVRDIVGLYLDPPEAAMVLAVDEKSQIQALDRTAPMLPMMPGVPGRVTHDYVRHGTTSLFAALDAATGKVIGQTQRKHRHQEFLRFLRTIDRATPPELELHLVLDNYATHKTPAIGQWLLKHPRFHLHFTPTYSSWLNLVERWFAELTNRKLRRSAHRSVAALEADVTAWIEAWNADPKPFVWTKTADDILETIAAYCQRVNDSGH